MHADTSAIRVFGEAQAGHTAVLQAVEAMLASAHPTADALGPAGAAFTRALTDALRMRAEQVARLSGAVADASGLAEATATAFTAADSRNGWSITGVGS